MTNRHFWRGTLTDEMSIRRHRGKITHLENNKIDPKSPNPSPLSMLGGINFPPSVVKVGVNKKEIVSIEVQLNKKTKNV